MDGWRGEREGRGGDGWMKRGEGWEGKEEMDGYTGMYIKVEKER